jgi:NADH:ubiquinone oxidoreductase subunit F (NADH-binding)
MSEQDLAVDRSILSGGSAVVSRSDSEQVTGVARMDLASHREAFGRRPSVRVRNASALIDELAEVALTGRGGGHFPAAVKWRSVAAAGSGGIVVVNGAEGEPGSAKDAVLLQTRPHLVLDGLVCAVEAVGASEAIVWLHQGAESTMRSVRSAIAERVAAGEDGVPIRVVLAPDRYVSGEATSIIRTIEGGPTLPRFVSNPAQPWSDGARPILVNNAETMARAGLVALRGAAQYVPTSLLTIVSRGHRSVVEVGAAETFGTVIATHWSDYAAGEPQAVLVGGYGGSWASWSGVRHLRVDAAALKPAGLSIGAGLVGPLPMSACGIEESTRLVNYLAGQSARQCGPCVFGLAAVAQLCDDLTAGALTSAGRKRLTRFMDEIAGRGACRHPDGAIRMITSALHVFSADVAKHRRGRTCNAKVYGVMPLPGEHS